MSDVRALLRQQRTARRVEDPYAAYSNAGKLRCTLCPTSSTKGGELVWEAHVRSSEHKQRVQQAAQRAAKPPAQQNGDHTEGRDQDQGENDIDDRARQRQAGTGLKRKLDDDDEDANGDVEMEDSIRRKRSRPEMPSPSAVVERDADEKPQPSTATTNSSTTHTPPSAPPPLSRRTSRTPSLGVEIQIPSRPATPAHRDGSNSSTPGAQSQQQQQQPAATAPVTPGLPSRRASTVLAAHPTSAFAGATTAPTATANASTSKPPNGTSAVAAADVDADEWAAFEAEIAAEEIPYDADAVIARPAMTAEESAQAKAAAENDEESRKAKVDVDLEDEKEEAALALEREFDDMEELEARVRRLKSKREELMLRRRAGSQGNEGAPSTASILKSGEASTAKAVEEPQSSNKENVETAAEGQAIQEDDDEDDDDDDDDDWAGFRFRTS